MMTKQFLLKEYEQRQKNTNDVFEAIAKLTGNNIVITNLIDLYADCRAEEREALAQLEKYGIKSSEEAVYGCLHAV